MKKQHKNKCRNKVVIEMSVSELMKCRVTIGQLTPFLREIRDILNCLGKDAATLEKRIEKVCYDYRQTLDDIKMTKEALPFLESLFAYDDED
jgi:hypothetical protein